MDFSEKIKDLSGKIEKYKKHIQGEEAAKQSFVNPFIRALGFDETDPLEVKPEFTADIGSKKGEKVDYAIMKGGQPIMLIECKTPDINLDDKQHLDQLMRYFGVTDARVAILTNGIQYRFFTDLEKTNLMDQRPFMAFSLLDIQDDLIAELQRFCNDKFDISEIVSAAAELKYTREIKLILAEQVKSPTDDFVRFFATQIYSGKFTAKVMDQFRDVTQRAVRQFINDQIAERLKSAMDKADQNEPSQPKPAPFFAAKASPPPQQMSVAVKVPDKIKGDDAQIERNQIRQEFWTLLLAHAVKKTNLHRNISPRKDSSIWSTAGKPGLFWQYAINLREGRVQLYIDTGIAGGDKTEKGNIQIFRSLEQSRASIEQALGEPLEWENKEGVRACGIFSNTTGGYRNDKSEWPDIMDQMVKKMIRLEAAFRPYIAKL